MSDKQPEGLTTYALARLHGVNRRAIQRMVADLRPVRVRGDARYYDAAEVAERVAAYKGAREGTDDLDRRIKQAKLEKLQFELEVAKGRYVSRSDLAEQLAAVFARQRGILSGIVVQFPGLAAGRPADEIRGLLETELETRFCREFRAWADEMERNEDNG